MSRFCLMVPLVLAVASVAGAQGPDDRSTVPTTAATVASSSANGQPSGTSSSPLTIHLGDADFLIGGFLDATAVMRSTNVGSGIGTSFSGIPFSNTAKGQLEETRFSAQNSRVSLAATSKVGDTSVKGYVEADFLGYQPTNAFVSSNSNSLRMRLYWVDLVHGKFEFVGGQSWSLLTPNRNGLSPNPSDVFFTQDMDTNYQVGLTWARQNQFRFIAHVSKTVAAGLSLENPQQYVGSAVVLPAAFDSTQVDSGSGNTSTPNRFPDVIGKIAFDPVTGKTHQHIEIAGLVRGYKTYNNTTGAAYSETGTGVSLNANVEPVKNLHLIGTSFFSNGGGRYIYGLGPDFIVNADSSLTLVGARSGIGGVEFGATPKTALFAYYGIAKFDQVLATDTNGKAIGYGTTGATGANHTINETTVGLNQTLFRDAKYGALQLIFQVLLPDADALVRALGHANTGQGEHSLLRRPLRAAVGMIA